MMLLHADDSEKRRLSRHSVSRLVFTATSGEKGNRNKGDERGNRCNLHMYGVSFENL